MHPQETCSVRASLVYDCQFLALRQFLQMKCLLVVPSLVRAGAETQAVDLANGLADRGNKVHLAVLEPRLDQQNRLGAKVQLHKLCRRAWIDRQSVKSLAHIIDDAGVQIVLGVMQYSTLYAYLAAKASKCRPGVVSAIHTTSNVGLKEELQDRLIYRHLLRQLPAVVFVCENQRQHWIERFPELKTLAQTVHNGVDPQLFQSKDFVDSARKLRGDLAIPTHAVTFACIAAFRREKGHALLFRAFARLPTDTYLICAGDGPTRGHIEQLAQELNLVGRVRFLGNVSDVRPVIAASNATVLASTAVETFSMAMLESMALEVPMIAPRIGGMDEAILPGETGYLFPVGDEYALENCLRDVAADPITATRLGRAASKLIAYQFSKQKMILGTETILRNLIRPSERTRGREEPEIQR